MLPYIVLVAAAIYFIIQGIGWLDELAERRSSEGGKGPWQEVKPSGALNDKRLEVFREFLDPDDNDQNPS
jgi:hypothetical protein